jgi:L-cysteine desulfidase
MPRFATAFRGATALALLLALALPAAAQAPIQDVTVRQLNALSQENIQALMALPINATDAEYQALLTNEWVTTSVTNTASHIPVRFTGIVLSDPRNSGMASINTDTGVTIPNRIHFFGLPPGCRHGRLAGRPARRRRYAPPGQRL